MAVQPDGMRILGAVDFFVAHALERGRQHLIAGAARPEFLDRDILQSVGRAHRVLEPRRHVGLALAEHVAVVLRVGIEPQRRDAEVAVQHVTTQNGGIDAHQLRAAELPLNFDAGLEPGGEPEITDALAHPPDHVVGLRHAGRDDLVGERFLNDLPRHPIELAEHGFFFGLARRDQIDRQRFGGHHLGRPHRSERLQHAVPLPAGEAVGEGEGARGVDGDLLRLPLLDDLLEDVPLLVPPELGLPVGGPAAGGGGRHGLHATHRLEHVPLRRAAERNALDPGRPAIEEHIDRAPARGERRGRRNGGEDGVFVVLAHRHHPHVHALAPHERGERAFHAELEPLLLFERLLAQRAEGAERVGGRGSGGAGAGGGRRDHRLRREREDGGGHRGGGQQEHGKNSHRQSCGWGYASRVDASRVDASRGSMARRTSCTVPPNTSAKTTSTMVRSINV